jgi:hypothetical protein
MTCSLPTPLYLRPSSGSGTGFELREELLCPIRYEPALNPTFDHGSQEPDGLLA